MPFTKLVSNHFNHFVDIFKLTSLAIIMKTRGSAGKDVEKWVFFALLVRM